MNCAYCGAPVKVPAESLPGLFSRSQRLFLAALVSLGGDRRFVTSEEIACEVYGATGGPNQPSANISMTFDRMATPLARYGWWIEGVRGEGGGYYLKPLEA